MSGLAKVFLVINLFLAIVFLGSSAVLFSVRKDFKKEMGDLQAEYSQKFTKQAKQVANLEQKLKVQALHLSVQLAEIINQKARNAELVRNLSRSQTDLKSAQEKVSTKDSRIETLNADLANLSQNINNLSTRLDKANKERETALVLAKAANQKKNETFITFTQQQEELDALNARIEKITAENENLKTKLKLTLNGVPIGNNGSVLPDITAKVMEVNNDYVMISVGKDDKVVGGMLLTVSRNGQYLGDIKILKVYKDFAGAEIVYKVNPKTEIKEGDNVNTKRV